MPRCPACILLPQLNVQRDGTRPPCLPCRASLGTLHCPRAACRMHHSPASIHFHRYVVRDASNRNPRVAPAPMQMDADPGTSSQRAEELLSMPLQQNEALEVCCAVLRSCLLGALVLPAAGMLQLLAACCWRAVLVYACCQDAAGRQALCAILPIARYPQPKPPPPSYAITQLGALPNGLRYVLLPNRSPPSRCEAHLEIHAGSGEDAFACICTPRFMAKCLHLHPALNDEMAVCHAARCICWLLRTPCNCCLPCESAAASPHCRSGRGGA